VRKRQSIRKPLGCEEKESNSSVEIVISGVARITVKEHVIKLVTADLRGWRSGCQQDGSVCSWRGRMTSRTRIWCLQKERGLCSRLLSAADLNQQLQHRLRMMACENR
jgi:hypothetical protein